MGRGVYRAIRSDEIADTRTPKATHGTRLALMDALVELFDGEPERVWNIDQLLQAGHATSSLRCTRALCELYRQGRVLRIGRGCYTSVANPAKPRLARKQKHTMRSRAFKAGGDAVANWNS